MGQPPCISGKSEASRALRCGNEMIPSAGLEEPALGTTAAQHSSAQHRLFTAVLGYRFTRCPAPEPKDSS